MNILPHRRKAFSSSVWTPASIPNLVIAHVANDVSGNDGDAIQIQPAAFGTSYSLSQSDATKRPLLQLFEVNGHTALQYDGSNDVMMTAADVPELANMAGLTVFVVCKYPASPGGLATMVGQYNFPEGPFFLGAGVSAGGITYVRVNSGATVGTLGTFSVGSQGFNDWKLLMLKFESNSISVVKNNITTIIGPSAYTGPLYDSPRAYAEGGASVSAGHWPGMVAERLVYNRALTSTEINTLSTYLKTKYGL